MNVSELLETSAVKINSIILDPRPGWVLVIAIAVEPCPGAPAQIPPDIAADLLRGPLIELEARLVAALEGGTYSNGRQGDRRLPRHTTK
jgi:hypothetical protein